MENFSFGSKPRMKEVPPGTEATFSFNGVPEIVETEYGEKYSYPLLEDGPIDMSWESKCQAAKQLFNDLNDSKTKYHKELKQAYLEKKWQLTRFDSGAYWLDVL
jgi:hypothetical protein